VLTGSTCQLFCGSAPYAWEDQKRTTFPFERLNPQCASQVQRWAFLACQQTPLDELVDMAYLSVDVGIREIPGVPVYLHLVIALQNVCELLLFVALKAPTSPVSLVD